MLGELTSCLDDTKMALFAFRSLLFQKIGDIVHQKGEHQDISSIAHKVEDVLQEIGRIEYQTIKFFERDDQDVA